MRPQDHSWEPDGPSPGTAVSFGGGADSSNRPWETDSLRLAGPALARLLGPLSVAAAAVLALADLALLYSPDGGYGFGSYEPLAGVPRWRLLAGHYTGVLLLPAYIGGYWLASWALRAAGARWSWPVFILGAWGTAVAVGYQAMLSLLALVVQLGAGEPALSAALLERAGAFTEPLHATVNVLFVAASAWFAAAVLSGRGGLPRWLAAAVPMLAALAFELPYLLAPRLTPALVLAPASFHLGHLVFFALVTVALRRSPRLA